MKPKYPNVECSHPGHRPEPGYVVCPEVIAGAAPVEVVPASPGALGQILCDADHSGGHLPVLVCACCCREKGWVRWPVVCVCGVRLTDREAWLAHRTREAVRVVAFSWPVVAEEPLAECLTSHDSFTIEAPRAIRVSTCGGASPYAEEPTT